MRIEINLRMQVNSLKEDSDKNLKHNLVPRLFPLRALVN